MNKISKLLMALMMTGMLVSVDAGAQVVRRNVTTISATAPTAGSVAEDVAVSTGSHVAVGVISSATLGAASAFIVECPAGTYKKKFTGKNEKGGQCLPCTGNTYSSERGSKKCKTCPSGKEPNKDHTACVNKCPANAVCKDGTNFVCKPGYYKASSTAKTCTKCPQNADKCLANQIYCKPGDYLTDKKTCAKCPAGFECRGNLYPARPCGTGMYAPAGSKKCLPCPDNTYTPEEKAAKCTPCPKNAKCSLKDFKCNKGYYKNSDKAKSCKECSAGYMCNGTSRFKCPAGTYASAGSFVCTPCSGDTYSSAGASKCKSCPKGQKANKNHTACVKA